MKKRLLMMTLLAVSVTGAWALTQDGDGYYLLSTAQDWQDFAAIVQTTPTAKAKMTTDIDLGTNQTMIGTAEHPFQGEFNGQRHTLTLNLNTSVTNTAPFAYVGDGAIIQRMMIAGTIQSTASALSGVIGQAQGNIHLNIVQVDATVKSGTGTSGDQYLGGLIGTMSGATITIDDCFFTGVQNSTRCTSAVAGIGSGSIIMNNTLLMGTYSGQNKHPICHDGLSVSGANNYLCMSYTGGSFPACVTEVTRERIATGEIAMLLQQSHTDEQIWGQDLVNFSSTPILTEDISMRVYSNGDGMYGNDPELPGNTAYAIWCEDNTTLYFDYRVLGLQAGDTYQGHTVTAVWSGANVVASPSNDKPLWQSTCAATCTDVVFTDVFQAMRPVSLYGWFYEFKQMTTLTHLENLSTKRATTMAYMFYYCSSLEEIDLNSFDISSDLIVTSMFERCSNLAAIYSEKDWSPTIPSANGANMFLYCPKLKGKWSYNSSQVSCWYARTAYYFTPSTGDATAYAIWCEDNTTLYFDYTTIPYYQGHKYNGHKITNIWTNSDITNSPTSNEYAYNSPFYVASSSCTDVVFTEACANIKPVRTYNWFYYFQKLETVTGLRNLDLSEVTDMKNMFFYCSSLKAIDLSHINLPQVTTMMQMFLGCASLQSIDMNYAVLPRLQEMSYMFDGCTALQSFTMDHAQTPELRTLPYMFANCTALTDVNMHDINTQYFSNLDNMFYGCTSLTTIDLSDFNMPYLSDTSGMFNGCTALTTIFSDIDWKATSTAYSYDAMNMFLGCTSLVGAISFDSSKTNGDYANPETGYFTSLSSLKPYVMWFAGNNTLYMTMMKELIIKYDDNDKEIYTYDNGDEYTYDGQTVTRAFSGEEVTNYNNSNNSPSWKYLLPQVEHLVIDKLFKYVKPKNLRYFFSGVKRSTTIEGWENLNTSEATSMSLMFDESEFTTLDLSHFNTSKVTEMYWMFRNCTSLKAIIVGDGWDTSAISDFNYQYLFNNNYLLVGEDGSKYTSDNTSDTRIGLYAHTGAGGLLTKKTVEIPMHDGGDGYYYGTYYKSNVNRVADEDTEVYTGSVSSDGTELELTKVDDGNIKAGQGVVLKRATAGNAILTSVADEAAGDFSTNVLKGNDQATATSGIDGKIYVLSKKDGYDVGFYSYTGTTLDANKAYLSISSVAASAPMWLPFGEPGETTDIDEVRNGNEEMRNAPWFTLDGRKLNGKPTAKGLYIVNGRKVIIH